MTGGDDTHPPVRPSPLQPIPRRPSMSPQRLRHSLPHLIPGPPPIASLSSHWVAVQIADASHDFTLSLFTLVAPKLQERHELWVGLLEGGSLQPWLKRVGSERIEGVSPAILALFRRGPLAFRETSLAMPRCYVDVWGASGIPLLLMGASSQLGQK
ncbi:hypothetical protein C8F01DRAFT_449536 [Mycena amicta]|nr:hypothetical protein C8F01DRAFT_449536 [Mycena amicta]